MTPELRARNRPEFKRGKKNYFNVYSQSPQFSSQLGVLEEIQLPVLSIRGLRNRAELRHLFTLQETDQDLIPSTITSDYQAPPGVIPEPRVRCSS